MHFKLDMATSYHCPATGGETEKLKSIKPGRTAKQQQLREMVHTLGNYSLYRNPPF